MSTDTIDVIGCATIAAMLVAGVVYSAESDTRIRTMALAAQEIGSSLVLLSTDSEQTPSVGAAANALSELSLAMSQAIHRPSDSVDYHLDRARGALTAAIELTRGGNGTVPSLKGERDHLALGPLRQARTLLEGLDK